MSRSSLKKWWQGRSTKLRKPIVFVVGLLLIITSAATGWLPGPGGIPIFILGIAVLASEFDWAESFKLFVLEKVPSEVKKRWQPTPKWRLAFDLTATGLLLLAIFLVINEVVWPVLTITSAAVVIFIFNEGRLAKLKAFWNRLFKRKK